MYLTSAAATHCKASHSCSHSRRRSSTFTLSTHIYVEIIIGLQAQMKCKIISLSLLLGIAESSSLTEVRLPQLPGPRSNQ